MKKINTLIFLLSVCMLTQGCFALFLGATGGGAVIYMKGDLENVINHPVKKVYRAALKAAKKQSILVLNDDIDRHKAHISGEYEDGTSVKIDIKALTERTSEIKIRVGVMGQERKSVGILNSILNNL